MIFDFKQGSATKGSYSGVGSRKLCMQDSLLAAEFSFYMTLFGYRLNTGAADGIDSSTEWGAKIAYDFMSELGLLPHGEYDRVMSIFLPWRGFNGRPNSNEFITSILPKAAEETSRYHPAWNSLSQAGKKMMARNYHQVHGRNLLSPVDFVFCWTPDGASISKQTSSKTGGTGQAIRIASDANIKVLNFGLSEHRKILEDKLSHARALVMDKFHIDGKEFIKQKYLDLNPFPSFTFEDYKEVIKREHDDILLIHGANCQNAMGSGIAKDIRDNFSQAYQADRMTRKGDLKKMGTYTFASIPTANKSNLTIINAYTQFRYSRNPGLHVDYEKTRKVMRSINSDFKERKVIIPKIGAGLANGCWITLSNIIKTELKDKDVCLLRLPDESLSLEKILENSKSNKANNNSQMSLI